MKQALVVVAAFTLAAVVAQNHGPRWGVAVAATPTPAALQYDEITRMIVPPATPPAPGSFQAEYQAALGGDDQESQHHGLAGAINNMMGNPEEMMERMSRGQVTRYTIYKGWIRTDYLATQTATIQKCAERQYINLNLGKKTYSVQNTQPPCPPVVPGMPSGGTGQSSQSQPGTADITISGSSKDLGPLTIDGIGTAGYDSDMQMKTTNATGSCRDNDFSMAQMKYISQIRVPRPYCPLPRTMTTGGMMSRGSGGCEPRMHVTGSLSGMNDTDRLVMYLRMTMGGDTARGMNMVVERGNVKWLSGAPADALFTIPQGFAQQ